jgi:hypothetical protein
VPPIQQEYENKNFKRQNKKRRVKKQNGGYQRQVTEVGSLQLQVRKLLRKKNDHVREMCDVSGEKLCPGEL